MLDSTSSPQPTLDDLMREYARERSRDLSVGDAERAERERADRAELIEREELLAERAERANEGEGPLATGANTLPLPTYGRKRWDAAPEPSERSPKRQCVSASPPGSPSSWCTASSNSTLAADSAGSEDSERSADDGDDGPRATVSAGRMRNAIARAKQALERSKAKYASFAAADAERERQRLEDQRIEIERLNAKIERQAREIRSQRRETRRLRGERDALIAALGAVSRSSYPDPYPSP